MTRFRFELLGTRAAAAAGAGAEDEAVEAVVRFVVPGGDDPDRTRWAAVGFRGRPDQLLTLPPDDDGGPVTYLVGVAAAPADPSATDGSTTAGGWRPTGLRRAAAVVARALRDHAVIDVVVDPSAVPDRGRAAAAEAIAEGFTIGGHELTAYKGRRPVAGSPADADTDDPQAVAADRHATDADGADAEAPDPGDLAASDGTLVRLVGGGGKATAAALDQGARAGRAVALVRDLGNTPGGDLTPEVFAAEVERLGAEHGFAVEVLDEAALRERDYAGVLGVNRGSSRPPRFVTLRYEPSGRARGHLALVGKGVTFDSGGLSIKTMTGMMGMKGDMAGAAAVVGAFTRFADVGVRSTVTGYLPMTDNMTGPDATRPGDVLRYRNGTTVEVLNTDAEGRLILADGLIDACAAGPDAVVDLATLTGAITTALGNRVAGLMGTNEALLAQIEAAADAAGERLWRLPLPEDERSRLDSDVADLRNIPKGVGGGSLLAGLFLREFVAGSIPWAHLDIAGSAWSDEVKGEAVRGATGYGVRLLVALARSFRVPGPGAASNA